MTSESEKRAAECPLRRQDIRAIAGNIEDAKVAAIERAGATAAELEEAKAWASGLTGVMGKEHRALSGKVAELYEILTADEGFDDEDRG